jgi:ATP/maltotriose-dependent transcriptional regulator MalT
MNENETATESQTEELPAQNAETQTEEPQGSKDTDWKAEARKWEARAKAAKGDSELAAKWREYEASLKPVQERLAEELAAEKARAESATATLLRYEVAAEKGISGDATRLLKGNTRDELEAEAELLLSLLANQSKPKTPLPDENQGKPAPAQVGQITDRDALKNMSPADIMKAKAEGRLDSILGKH